MDTRDIQMIGALCVVLWIFFSGAFLPRLVNSVQKVILISLLVGSAIVWGFHLIAPRPPPTIMVFTLFIVAGAFLGMVHFLILERRRTGRWTFLDPEQKKS